MSWYLREREINTKALRHVRISILLLSCSYIKNHVPFVPSFPWQIRSYNHSQIPRSLKVHLTNSSHVYSFSSREYLTMIIAPLKTPSHAPGVHKCAMRSTGNAEAEFDAKFRPSCSVKRPKKLQKKGSSRSASPETFHQHTVLSRLFCKASFFSSWKVCHTHTHKHTHHARSFFLHQDNSTEVHYQVDLRRKNVCGL